MVSLGDVVKGIVEVMVFCGGRGWARKGEIC